jgi:hypothetical protein
VTPEINSSFGHKWRAEILDSRPQILPARHFVYPLDVEEVEHEALEILVRPEEPGHAPFLATCALGFRDPIVPTGIWSMPNPMELCAVSGGYAYVIDTSAPERFTMLPFRPVLRVLPATEAGLMLFIGNRNVVAWNTHGVAWESPKLSDEGVTITNVERGKLHGMGWNLMTDKETAFALDLETGRIIT